MEGFAMMLVPSLPSRVTECPYSFALSISSSIFSTSQPPTPSHNFAMRVNNEYFEAKKFTGNFIASFCVTVYKYQGADINEPYNIYDINRMEKNNHKLHSHALTNLIGKN